MTEQQTAYFRALIYATIYATAATALLFIFSIVAFNWP